MESTRPTQNPFFVSGIAICSSLFFLALLFVGLRSYVRLRVLRKWGVEDWMCSMQILLFAVYNVTVVTCIYNGGGMDIEDLPDSAISTILFWSWLSSICYVAITMLIKATIIFMYLKIFAPTKFTCSWWAMVAALVVNTSFYMASVFATIFECAPVWCVWTDDQTGCNCPRSWHKFAYANKVWNCATDFAILALPALFISKLQASRRQKLRVILLFTLAASLYPAFGVVGLTVRSSWATSDNFTREVLRLALLLDADICTGIICCCIPALRLCRRLFKHDANGAARQSQYNRPRTRRYGLIERPFRLRDVESDTTFIENEFAEMGLASELKATHSRAPTALVESSVCLPRRDAFAEAWTRWGGITKTVEIDTSIEDAPAETSRAERGEAYNLWSSFQQHSKNN